MIFQLNDDLWFPDPYKGEEDGLFAVGGDLSAERLLLAYAHGIFPWYSYRPEDNEFLPECFFNEDGTPQIRWYCPLNRFVIFPEEIHISHSMRQLMRSDRYHVTIGQDFEGVIRRCGEQREHMKGAWLGEHIVEAYTRLFNMGNALSVETRNKEGRLVGGLYGVLSGNMFIGESMFSDEPNTSKLALITLAGLMQDKGLIIDCQLETSHLKSMGGRYISYEEYMQYLGH